MGLTSTDSFYQDNISVVRLLRTLLYPFLLPGGAICLAAALLVDNVDPAVLSRSPTSQAPVLVTGLGVLLAWRLRRDRVVLALFVVLLGHLAVTRSHSGALGPFDFPAIAVLLPLNLALTRLLPERCLLTRSGLGHGVLFLVQVVLTAWLYHRYGPTAQAWLEHKWVAALLQDAHVPLPPLGITAFATAALLLGACWGRHPTALDSSFLWALGALFAALTRDAAGASHVYFATAGAILLVGLIEACHGLAYRDELTRLPARRALNEALAGAGRKFTLAMVDVDHFKKVNDRHGHDVGDQVLKMLAGHLTEVTGGGRAYRYGGEEFTLLFPRKGLDQVLPHLERLREAIAAEPFRLRRFPRPFRKSQRPKRRTKPLRSLRVTVSMGVAQCGAQNPNAAAVTKAADRALYRAKRGGRNQVRK